MQSDSTWPAVTSEAHPWAPTIDPDLLSRSVRERHRGPYDAALVPSIATATPDVPADVAALVAEATAEIARFDAEVGAEVAPFATVLLRSESASSSQIENLSSGAKAIVLAEMGSRDKRNATEIVGNVAAMRAALDLADRLDEHAVLAMHAALMTGHDESIAGRWRQEQVWIGGDSVGPHGAAYVAPHHDHVPTLVRDLVAFMRRTDLPLLVQAAVAHAQFETIHPFPDGNGRTGRALVHALLRGHGLTRRVTVPVSAGLLADTRGYFQTLTDYRRGDPTPIIAALAHASLDALAQGRLLVADLQALRAGWDERITARRGAGAWHLADLLLRQPIVDAALVSQELAVRPENAIRSIRTLEEAGILVEFTGFARNRMWQSREVLDVLDDFAARAARRTGALREQSADVVRGQG